MHPYINACIQTHYIRPTRPEHPFPPTPPEHQLFIRPDPSRTPTTHSTCPELLLQILPTCHEHKLFIPTGPPRAPSTTPPARPKHKLLSPPTRCEHPPLLVPDTCIHTSIHPSIHPSIQHAGIEISIPKCMHRFSRSVIDSFVRSLSFLHLGGCQNYGPFLGPYYNTAPII